MHRASTAAPRNHRWGHTERDCTCIQAGHRRHGCVLQGELLRASLALQAPWPLPPTSGAWPSITPHLDGLSCGHGLRPLGPSQQLYPSYTTAASLVKFLSTTRLTHRGRLFHSVLTVPSTFTPSAKTSGSKSWKSVPFRTARNLGTVHCEAATSWILSSSTFLIPLEFG